MNSTTTLYEEKIYILNKNKIDYDFEEKYQYLKYMNWSFYKALNELIQMYKPRYNDLFKEESRITINSKDIEKKTITLENHKLITSDEAILFFELEYDQKINEKLELLKNYHDFINEDVLKYKDNYIYSLKYHT